MAARGTPYKGVLFLGVMITKDGPKLYEYNVRFGDPECQVLMLRLKSDLLAALLATADGVLETFDLRWHDEPALTVVMASQGLSRRLCRAAPRSAASMPRAASRASRSSTPARARRATRLLAAGGRVLNVTARGRTVAEAKARAEEAIAKIDWPDGFYRTRHRLAGDRAREGARMSVDRRPVPGLCRAPHQDRGRRDLPAHRRQRASAAAAARLSA